MVHLFAWFLAYAEQMFVSKRQHILLRWNLFVVATRARRRTSGEKEYHRNENLKAKESRTS